MTKEQAHQNKPSPGSRVRDALKGLLDRVKDEAEELAGMFGPQPRPALQPIPVRNPKIRR